MQVRNTLMQTTRRVFDGRAQTASYPNNYYGYGFVDAYAAALLLNPKQITIENNYPNPFNASTTISFSLPQPGNVQLEIYNLLGQRMRTLLNDRVTVSSSRQWDGKDDRGRIVASGVYFARLKTPTGVGTIKMLYLR
jgi:hypothetical protein